MDSSSNSITTEQAPDTTVEETKEITQILPIETKEELVSSIINENTLSTPTNPQPLAYPTSPKNEPTSMEMGEQATITSETSDDTTGDKENITSNSKNIKTNIEEGSKSMKRKIEEDSKTQTNSSDQENPIEASAKKTKRENKEQKQAPKKKPIQAKVTNPNEGIFKYFKKV
jgi:hypothetical protein